MQAGSTDGVEVIAVMGEGVIEFTPVPIVRCRDCRHMHTVRSWYSDNLADECLLHASYENALGRYPTEPDGFCAWGERRADDGANR